MELYSTYSSSSSPYDNNRHYSHIDNQAFYMGDGLGTGRPSWSHASSSMGGGVVEDAATTAAPTRMKLKRMKWVLYTWVIWALISTLAFYLTIKRLQNRLIADFNNRRLDRRKHTALLTVYLVVRACFSVVCIVCLLYVIMHIIHLCLAVTLVGITQSNIFRLLCEMSDPGVVFYVLNRGMWRYHAIVLVGCTIVGVVYALLIPDYPTSNTEKESKKKSNSKSEAAVVGPVVAKTLQITISIVLSMYMILFIVDLLGLIT